MLNKCFFFFSVVNNLVPRALFSGFGGGAPTSKAREKRPGDEVAWSNPIQSRS